MKTFYLIALFAIGLAQVLAFAGHARALAAAPAPNRRLKLDSCVTNAECLQRGLPLLRPRRFLNSRDKLNPPPARPSVTAGSTITLSYAPSVQSITFANSGYYFFQAVGGAGGNANNGVLGGKSALAEASVYITAGTTVSFVTGGQGGSGASQNLGGGGGGGSFVYVGGTALLAAGGGGGACSVGAGRDATDQLSGTNGGGNLNPLGGDSGGGGQGGYGGGGAGFNGDGGQLAVGGDLGQGGKSRTASPPWTGGTGGRGVGSPGGFGGGGGGYYDGTSSTPLDGGGGGGYSGGGGGGDTNSAGAGGGGGSYTADTYGGMAVQNQRTAVYDVRGDGFIRITPFS